MRPRPIFAILLALALAPPVARGHDLGMVQVYATFLKDGTYRIDVPIDPEHLPPENLGGPAGTTRYGPIAGLTPAVDRRLGGFLRDFVDGAVIAFDGRRVSPRPAIGPADAEPSPERLTLQLSGPIPAGSRVFTWTHAMDLGPYPVALQREGEEEVIWEWLKPGLTSPPFPLTTGDRPPTREEVVRLYLKLGFTHILPAGPDHILFVLGIFLLSRRLKPILLQVTAFTVAHTLTLGLSIYGVVSLPPAVVEPLIALSLVVVAVENILSPELRPWRLALVFAFGLLHGLGFAGVLSDLGLPPSELVTALLSFNVGVEIGQLAVIGLAWLFLWMPFQQRAWYRQRVVVPASCLIAAVGLYWSVQRVFF